MNLKNREGMNHRFPTVIAVLSIAVITGLSVVMHPLIGSSPDVSERPLGVEEQQVVLSAVDRLEHRRPELSASATKFDLFLNDHSTEVFTSSKELLTLEKEKEKVKFSVAFFDADSVAQEQAIEPLLDKGSPFNVPVSSKSLAVRPR